MKKFRFLSGKKPAQAMVEFAIALPVLLLLLYGILEAGRLLFMYSTVVTASRQAARYGSATGEGNGGVFRFQDCKGIRAAANSAGYLGAFDTITIKHDTGPADTNPITICTAGDTPATSFTTDDVKGNRTRLYVEVTKNFTPLVKLVPFRPMTIKASSARTILYSVPIVVEQQQQEWFKLPTEITMSVSPNPAEILQPVTVNVKVTGGTPTGKVYITGADSNCSFTLPADGSGTGSCSVIFNTAGDKVVTAFYEGDANYLAYTKDAPVTITLINTVTTILSDLPDASVKGDPFTVIVQVTGNTMPTGTVNIDGGNGVSCSITLNASGIGNCSLTYNSTGSKMLTANYGGDATHLPSSDQEPHSVIEGTPTPTQTPTATIPPTATTVPPNTPTFTPSPTATLIPTVVPSCNQMKAGAITLSGNSMNIVISNPYPYTIVMQDLTVTWNYDKGHQTGSDKTLRLQNVVVGGVSVWTGDVGNVSYKTIPTTATLPPGNTTITFYFNQSYDNLNYQEKIFINLLTPGCEGYPIDSSK